MSYKYMVFFFGVLSSELIVLYGLPSLQHE